MKFGKIIWVIVAIAVIALAAYFMGYLNFLV